MRDLGGTALLSPLGAAPNIAIPIGQFVSGMFRVSCELEVKHEYSLHDHRPAGLLEPLGP